MKAVILAGGLGSRLRPFTEIIPKPLLPIGEKSVLEIQIELLKANGVDEVFLATNYKSEYIENFFGDGSKYDIKLHISKEHKRLGTVGPISLLREQLDEPFVVMNGDILSKINIKEFYELALSKDAPLSVSIKEMITPFQFGNIFYEGDYVTRIEEKPNIRTKILAGIYVFKPELFDMIPHNEFYNMDTLILELLDKGKNILKYEINEYWLDIGQVDDYKKAQDIYKNNFSDDNKR